MRESERLSLPTVTLTLCQFLFYMRHQLCLLCRQRNHKRDRKILTQHKHTIVNTRWVIFVSNHLKMQNLERILLIIKPSRIFEYVPQKGLLSWSILSSSSVHELTCHGVGRASMSIPRSGRWRHNDMFPRDMRLPEHIQTTFRCIANVGGFRIMFGRFY